MSKPRITAAAATAAAVLGIGATWAAVGTPRLAWPQWSAWSQTAHAGSLPGTTATAATTPSAASTTAVAPADGSVQNLYVNISDRMIPSVVNIFTTQKVRALPRRMMPEDIWQQFFGGMGGGPGMGVGPGMPGLQEQAFRWQSAHRGGALHPPGAEGARPMSLGTGFIVEAESGGGLILTNYHVIAGADEVQVKFTEASDESEIPATVIGKDPELDVALLRVKTDRKLVPVALGDSDKLKVGEWVAAVGNPFGHGHSITHGIVSAKERTLPGGFGNYLQVDAPINPGNSGGPLVNLNAEVVGINNAIDARGPGIGFAIPVNAVKAVLAQLKTGKQVERGYLGVNIMPLRPDLAKALRVDPSGAPAGTPVVAEVMPGTPAAAAGMEPYDVITRIDGHAVKSTEDLMQTVMQVPVGHKVKAQVYRGGKLLELSVPVAKRPEPDAA